MFVALAVWIIYHCHWKVERSDSPLALMQSRLKAIVRNAADFQ